MRWIFYKSLEDFNPTYLYDVLKLRQDVFIIEQKCIYDDIDDKDKTSQHLLLVDDFDQLIGYLRIVPKGKKFDEYSLGRIVVSSTHRNKGVGKLLVEKGISMVRSMGEDQIRIEAQAHLEQFYAGLGFQTDSDVYSVDDIPHLQMVLTT